MKSRCFSFPVTCLLQDPAILAVYGGLLTRERAKHFRKFQFCALSYYGQSKAPPTPAPMTTEEELALFTRYKKRRTASVRDQLVRHYLCWAFGMASKFKGPRLDFDEAVGVANEGLMEALEEFNPALGFRFTTFAAWTLRRKLIRAIVNTYPVHVSDHVRKKWRLQSPEGEAKKMLEDGQEPRTLSEFFDRLGETSDADIAAIHTQPMDAPFAPAEAESPAEQADHASRAEELAAAIRDLTPLERKLIEARHYRKKPESFQQLAKRLHVSKSSARAAYDLAISRLKRHFGEEL